MSTIAGGRCWIRDDEREEDAGVERRLAERVGVDVLGVDLRGVVAGVAADDVEASGLIRSPTP